MVARTIQEGVGIDMFVKKFKKKCGVRGCKNVSDVFIISKRREMGNTVAICRQCMADALKSTERYIEPAKIKAEFKPLFPHPELDKVTISSATDNEPEPKEVIGDATEEFPIPVTEDTVTTDLFSTENVTAPTPEEKAPPKKTNKSSKKKK